MTGWKQYIISVVSCSLFCGIVTSLVSDMRKTALVKLICGVLLTLAMLSPLSKIDWERYMRYSWPDLTDADQAVAAGEIMAINEHMQRIKNQYEEYILNKASVLEMDIAVEVSVGENLLPAFVSIQGTCSSSAKERLQSILESDLGITKENQRWTGKQESSRS